MPTPVDGIAVNKRSLRTKVGDTGPAEIIGGVSRAVGDFVSSDYYLSIPQVNVHTVPIEKTEARRSSYVLNYIAFNEDVRGVKSDNACRRGRGVDAVSTYAVLHSS